MTNKKPRKKRRLGPRSGDLVCLGPDRKIYNAVEASGSYDWFDVSPGMLGLVLGSCDHIPALDSSAHGYLLMEGRIISVAMGAFEVMAKTCRNPSCSQPVDSRIGG